ncbi:MAG: hypothetical protein ACQCXQ_13655 [Verrucomicrobiales bacterium]|nr:hypothetical protein [Verrucomicrobiota bacterium JB025]
MLIAAGSEKEWGWTTNVGGGDFFRLFDAQGERQPYASMKASTWSHGPCFTEATYGGRVGDGVSHSISVSLGRTDDIVRGLYQIRMEVSKPVDFSRFVIFQMGADTYNSSKELKMAVGDENGLIREWDTEWGGNTYRGEAIECTGRIPWASLHDVAPEPNDKIDTPANRGMVIRSWSARLGGKPAAPWMAEHGLVLHRKDSSTMDIVPPPGVTRLEKGDYVEAVIEYLVIPKTADSYYGPSDALRDALGRDGNTWKMVSREALGNAREATVTAGTLERVHPDVRVRAERDTAAVTISRGIGYVPVTFTGLSSYRGYKVTVNGEPLDQSVHGNDFWQTTYEAQDKTWSLSYNIPTNGGGGYTIEIAPNR